MFSIVKDAKKVILSCWSKTGVQNSSRDFEPSSSRDFEPSNLQISTVKPQTLKLWNVGIGQAFLEMNFQSTAIMCSEIKLKNQNETVQALVQWVDIP